MNNLSILIYLADVAQSVGFTLNAIMLVAVITGFFCLIAIPATDGEVLSEENQPNFFKVCRTVAAAFFVSFILNAVIPGKNTLYAIAASEAGEQVIESPTAKKAVDALNRWLDQQAQPE